MAVPENFFDLTTSKFVAVRTWEVGTSALGYGETEATARDDSKSELFEEAFGKSDVVVWTDTGETAKRGENTWKIYAKV